MKKPMVYISATIVVVGMGVGGWYLYQNVQSETNTNTNQSTVTKYLNKLVYTKETRTGVDFKYEVFLADENGNSELIHSFVDPQGIGSPLFSIYDDDQIFAYRYQDDETRKIINYDGNLEDTNLESTYDFVFSNDQTKVAYLHEEFNENDSKIIVLDLYTNETEQYDAFFDPGYEAVAFLRPIAWSTDDSKIYADVTMYSEGCIGGLYEINRNTKEVKSLPIFEELNICVPTVFPQRDLAFGYDRSLSPFGDEDTDVVIEYYKVKLSDGTYSTFGLDNPTYYGQFLLAPSVDLIAYFDNNLTTWTTDLLGENARLVAEGFPIAWSDSNLLAIDEDSTTGDYEEVISVYNPQTEAVTEIAENVGFDESLQVIGWLKVPK